ncbi:MAG: hypothetical protein AB8B55_20920 [Mariniblastus sp.]
MNVWRKLKLVVSVQVLLWMCSSLSAQVSSFENAPINYQNAKVNDPVAKLILKMKAGNKLDYDKKNGYLDSVLKALDIPVSSQTLVFSKTSMQVHRISPSRPRAIYFNDDVYVGYVQGGVLEFGSTDAKQGPTFYSMKQELSDSPKIVRDKGQCIVCHASSRTQNVPGYLVRSVFPDKAGHPNFGSGTYTTTLSSPFKQRWGGWYVTGTHGDMRHLGNTIFKKDVRETGIEGANLKSLDSLISTENYLSPHSDIVALMVLEHQTQMHNAITFANFETRRALHQSLTMNKILGREPNFVSDSAKRRIKSAAENLVEHLLMCDEFPLTSPVAGSGNFSNEFATRGKRDSQGRSLRDFDLRTRMFKYPCSFLIYSESFAGLPDEVRIPTLTRLVEVLDGRDESKKFEHLSTDVRQAIEQILVETKPEFKKASRAEE